MKAEEELIRQPIYQSIVNLFKPQHQVLESYCEFRTNIRDI